MLALFLGLAIQTPPRPIGPPEFSQMNTFGTARMELPFVARTAGSAGVYQGSGAGVDFTLNISRLASAAKLPDKIAADAAAKLKTSPGMKSYKGGSVLQVKFGPASGWLLRMNFEAADGRQLMVDELIVPINLDLYDFRMTAELHDAGAVAWLSRGYASFRADVKGDKDAKIAEFTSDGLNWQAWKSQAARVALQVPRTPFVSSLDAGSGELWRRGGSYADRRYGVQFSVAELREKPSDSVSDILRKDLALFAVPSGKLTKPETGKSRTIDGAPASVADMYVEADQGPTKIVLLHVLKDRVLYRFHLSCPRDDVDANRNLDRIIESIRLLPAPSTSK